MKKNIALIVTFLVIGCSSPISAYANEELSARDRQTMAELDDDDDYLLEEVSSIVSDPLEGWNRAMFQFNDFIIEYAARPLHEGYRYVTPEFFRTGVSNFFYNLLFPVRFGNNLLQGRGQAAGVEMARFVLNTTAGLGGFIDVAKHKEPIVPVEEEDMGQTFGVWGIGEGFYIVWPIMGPSSARDSVGWVGDMFLNPVNYISYNAKSDFVWAAIGANAFRIFNDLENTLDLYDDMKRASVEPYYAVRDAYIQYRRAQVEK